MRRPWGVTRVLAVALLLVLPVGAIGSTSFLSEGQPRGDLADVELAEATQSLAQGRGPAEGTELTCETIGTLSDGCGTPESGSPTSASAVGWARLCAYDHCPPPARGGMGITYDPETGYVVMFGGIVNLTTASGTTFADTWIFRNGNWTELDIPGPTARLGEYMAYDYADHYVVLFGGGPYLTLNSSLYDDDTWTFQNGTWTELTLSVHPDARGLGGFVWDPVDDYLVMYGGMTSETDIHDDTWTFVHGEWQNISTSVHPPPLLSPAMTWDTSAGFLLLFGGATPSPSLEFGDDLEQTWSFVGGSWTNLTGSIRGTPPDGRILSALAYDPAQGYPILYGGWNTTTGALFGDTWIFLDNEWAELFISPTPAQASIGEGMIATSPTSGLFLFGGIIGNYTAYSATNATWVFGPPPANTSTPLGGPGASTYTLHALSAPGSCPAPTLTQGGSGVSPAALPPGAYNTTAAPCAGYTFDGWYSSGAVTIATAGAASTTVDVVGNGTLTAYYTPVSTGSYQVQWGPLALVVVGLVALGAGIGWVTRRREMLPPLSEAPPKASPPT